MGWITICKLRDLERKIEKLNEKLNASEKYIKDLELENDRLSKSWHKLATSPKVIHCNVDFSEIEKEIEKLTRASNNKISALKEENEQLKTENARLSSGVPDWLTKDKEIKALNVEIDRLKSEVARLEGIIADTYSWGEVICIDKRSETILIRIKDRRDFERLTQNDVRISQ